MLLDCVEVDSMTRLLVSESGSDVYLLRRWGDLTERGPVAQFLAASATTESQRGWLKLPALQIDTRGFSAGLF